MDWSNILQISAVLVGVGSLVVSGVLWNIIKAYKERVEQLVGETKQCASDHLVSQGQIAELKAQLADFRDLPLKDIQQTQAQILGTQKEIVELLTSIKGNANESK